MPRLSASKKEELIGTIKKGISINKIAKSMGLGKSTIYYYYKKIKGKKYKEPQFKITFSEREGEIVGIFTGDGSQYYNKSSSHYQTTIHFGPYPEYVLHVKDIFDGYFNKSWRQYREITKKGNIKYRLRVIDKKLFGYFSNYITYSAPKKHCTVVLNNIKFPRGFKIGFLRGLVDTDGTVTNKYKKRTRIMYMTTSKILSEQTKKFAEELGIYGNIYKKESKKYKTIYSFQIFQKDIVRFLRVIKPFKERNLGG